MVLRGVSRDRFEEPALGLCLPQALLVWEYSNFFFGSVLLWGTFFSCSYLYVGCEPVQKWVLLFKVGSGLWSRQGSRDMLKKHFFMAAVVWSMVLSFSEITKESRSHLGTETSQTHLGFMDSWRLTVSTVLVFCFWAKWAFSDACDPVAVKAVYGLAHLGGVHSISHPCMLTCSSRTPLEQGFMLLALQR